MTVEQLEIIHYRKKLVKLERKRRQWAEAFDQKLAAYRWVVWGIPRLSVASHEETMRISAET